MAALTTAVAPSPPPTLGRRGIYLLRTSKFLAPPVSSLKTGALSGRISAPARNFRVRAARKESVRVSLGFRAPQFELMEPLTAKSWSLDDFEAYPALLVMFICNHCPFVKHLKKDIVKLANFYMKKGLAVVAISSNSIRTHPQDGPDFMAQDAKAFNYPFPYLYDESQDVAHAFGAVCTPEFFLFKKNGRRPFELVYHGQFDDSRPSNNVPVTGRDLSIAIDCVLSFQPVALIQKPRSYTPKPSFLDSDVGFWTKVLIFIPLPPKPWMQHKVAPVDETVSTDLQLKEDDRLQKL